MIKGFKKYLVLIIFLGYKVLLFGQIPTVIPLDHNPALRNSKTSLLKNELLIDTVSLPFFDDFSYYWRSNKPDSKLWMDKYVYINNHYPVQPPSNGVATFDALDEYGNIYQNASLSFFADTLTSCPIDLGVSGLNNVYLSFFYQPQGTGDNPEPNDSLILQFKSPDNEWKWQWSAEGTNLHPFKQVLIPVGEDYLYKGFQFRFMNIVSLEQNTFNPGRKSDADHWHIDYVYMNSNRSATDTSHQDRSICSPMKSLITGYQSIPWKQLPNASASKIEPMVEMTYRNIDNIATYVVRYFTITDLYYNITSRLATPGSEDIEAGEILTFKQNISNPFESPSVDSALFEIKAYIQTDDDRYDRKDNDTTRYYQVFKDYFARDDGSPESGYGFNGYRAQNCAIACRYETFMTDTVQAIMIYFNPTEKNITEQYRFKIAVWRDNNGKPGELAYLSTNEYSPKTTGQFMNFDIAKPVTVTKYYWIGWVQVTSGFLNVGFDKNYNDKGNLWYQTGSWYADVNDGTLMIRPVLGKRKYTTTSVEQPPTNYELKLYPNPASNKFRIELETTVAVNYRDYFTEIYDVAGRLLYSAQYTNNDIDISAFEQGIYLVRLFNTKTGFLQTEKIIIIK